MAKPPKNTPEQEVFVFFTRYRELRPGIGKKCAKTYAIRTFNKLKDLMPINATEKRFKEPQ